MNTNTDPTSAYARKPDTNVIEVLVAALGVVIAARRARFSRAMLFTWLGSVVATGALILLFDRWAYGSFTSTGYSAGEITFSLSSFWPNLTGMPTHLVRSMPMLLLALTSLVAIGLRWRRRGDDVEGRRARSVDGAIAIGLALGWFVLWALYLCYTWTVSQLSGAGPLGHAGGPSGGASTLHVIRFYLPALGLIALLAT